jgi:hypothetical protein
MSETTKLSGGCRKRRLIAYVAGPYRDERGLYYIDRNINEAREVAAQLWAWDFSVICPHTNSRFMDGFEGIKIDAFLEGDLDQVERVDLVVLLPRWRESVGARGECSHAIGFGIPVLEWAHPEEREFLRMLGPKYLNNPEEVVNSIWPYASKKVVPVAATS